MKSFSRFISFLSPNNSYEEYNDVVVVDAVAATNGDGGSNADDVDSPSSLLCLG